MKRSLRLAPAVLRAPMLSTLRPFRKPTVSFNDPVEFGFERVPRLSAGISRTGNMLFQGDNQRVLASLEPILARRVRTVYIDPPYNNMEKYAHYDDRLGHEAWLSGMVSVVERLRGLLRDDGSLWISIDDKQLHYLKVAIDQVFGRRNFITTVVWQHRRSRENRRVFSNNHEYVLVYARDEAVFREACNKLPPTPEILARYRNPDNDPRGPWQSVSANVQAGHATESQFYTLAGPSGRLHKPPNGRCWIYTEERMAREIRNRNIWFGHDGGNVPRIKRFLSSTRAGLRPETLWPAADVGTSDSAKKHGLQMFPGLQVFDTPKPEALLARVLELSSDPGDLVLDAFLGSGTTAAVAHKMGRHYVGIDSGGQVASHAAERLRLVIQGEAGGVSAQHGWRGGGGFDYFRCRKG